MLKLLKKPNVPQLQVYFTGNVGQARDPNYNNNAVPEVSCVSVRNDLQYGIIQYLLLKVICLREVGKVYAGIIEWRQ